MRVGQTGPCGICEAPTARSYHFGVKSCKACAAFFRRTVALKIKYQCKKEETCIISHDKRYMCKQCRLSKCIRVGMMEELVESKGKVSERKLVKPVMPLDSPEQPSCSKSDSIEQIIAHYLRIESALIDRRRITFSNALIKDIIHLKRDCPYELSDLRKFNYKTYDGYSKCEFAIVFDYVRMFSRYEELVPQDQDMLFRFTLAVDSLISMAYYSLRIGVENKALIMTDASYYLMEPLPSSGDEQKAAGLFTSEEEYQRYKAIVLPMKNQWTCMVLPLEQLQPSFAEFALLKALVSWHICYYKFLPEDQEICTHQRNLIIRALFKLAEDKKEGSGVIRTGELILYINAVFEHVYDLLESLYMMNVFNIVPLGDFVQDLLKLDNGNFVLVK